MEVAELRKEKKRRHIMYEQIPNHGMRSTGGNKHVTEGRTAFNCLSSGTVRKVMTNVHGYGNRELSNVRPDVRWKVYFIMFVLLFLLLLYSTTALLKQA